MLNNLIMPVFLMLFGFTLSGSGLIFLYINYRNDRLYSVRADIDFVPCVRDYVRDISVRADEPIESTGKNVVMDSDEKNGYLLKKYGLDAQQRDEIRYMRISNYSWSEIFRTMGIVKNGDKVKRFENMLKEMEVK